MLGSVRWTGGVVATVGNELQALCLQLQENMHMTGNTEC